MGEAMDGVAERGIDLGESGFSFADVIAGAGTAVVEEEEVLAVGFRGAGAAFFSFTAAAASCAS